MAREGIEKEGGSVAMSKCSWKLLLSQNIFFFHVLFAPSSVYCLGRA